MTENFDDLFEDDPPAAISALSDGILEAQFEAVTGKVLPDETTVAVEVSRDGVVQSRSVNQAAQIPNNGKPPSKHQFLYLDLETIPDYGRLSQFDIPALPPMAEALLTPTQFCSQTLSEIKEWFENHSAPEQWLLSLEAFESTSKKPRVGLFEAIEKSRNALAARSKLLSVTPEYCRIVAWGWCAGSGIIGTGIASNTDEEENFLQWFWSESTRIRTFVGYNLLHFDLPVILTRSALLGVTPSRRINLSPYRNTDVCDLMVARWPKGGQMGLKKLARALGIEIPADDCDGSQVEMLYNTDPERLKAYVASDVEVTRKLHQFWSGYFCD